MNHALLLALMLLPRLEPSGPDDGPVIPPAPGPVLLGRAQPLPRHQYLETDLSLKDVDLREAVKQSGIDVPFPIEGRLSIKMHVAVPLDAPGDKKAYRLTGTVTLPRASVAGVELTNVRALVHLDDGVFDLRELTAKIAGTQIQGQGQARLDDDYHFEVNADLKDFDLSVLQKLSPRFRLPVALQGLMTVSARASGQLRSGAFVAAGSARADGLRVEQAQVDAASCKWEASADRLRLSDLQVKLYGGAVSGSVILPFSSLSAGQVALTIQTVDARAVTQGIRSFPVRLEGKVSGSVDATLPAAAANRPHTMEGTITLESPVLRVQGIPAQRLHANVTYQAGQASYRAVGETLGGRFKLEGKVAPTPAREGPPRAQDGPVIQGDSTGRLSVDGVRLSRLSEIMGQGYTTDDSFHGALSAELNYRHEGPDLWPVGSGQLNLRGLRYGQRMLIEGLRADLRLTAGELQVRNIDGLLGDGLLRGGIVLSFRDRERSRFSLSLEHVEASRLLAPLLGDRIHGPIDATLRGTLGREWRASGSVMLTRGTVFGVGLMQWRLPLDFTFVPAQGRGELQIRDSLAQVAGGRASGQLSLSWGTESRCQGSLRFLNADFHGLAARSSLRTAALGKVTGRFDFAATNLRSADDLSGVLDARLTESQALDLPGLNVLVPFLTPGRPAFTFDKAHIRGRLARGNFKVERLALMSPALRIVAEGNARLNGSLDFEVVAQTSGFGIPGLSFLASRIPPVGPIPLPLIAQVTTLLASQVVHLHLTGTVSNPTVHVEPLATLTEEAVRVFLFGYALPLGGGG